MTLAWASTRGWASLADPSGCFPDPTQTGESWEGETEQIDCLKPHFLFAAAAVTARSSDQSASATVIDESAKVTLLADDLQDLGHLRPPVCIKITHLQDDIVELVLLLLVKKPPLCANLSQNVKSKGPRGMASCML
eukprot:CAMPEP_0181400740 /NCGR_PEP_ID=MMETSP1110-20121109/2268_1 /TAXON_ID=174948 /ORGANISM="Symbiodinium sp., Strain CCMP421" /LENGTH=135 /DNA_ID=CAMNT_0023522843 /DNA_START=203 /DNA_END=611 /DNA_ORIENTATION=+